MLSEEALIAAVARELDVPFADLYHPENELVPDAELLERCDVEWLERLVALPLRAPEGHVVVAAQDPTDPRLADYMTSLFGSEFTTAISAPSQIRQILLTEASRMRATSIEAEAPEVAPVDNDPTEAVVARGPVLEWIDTTLAAAVAQRTSDLHFEIGTDGRMLFRLRIDGVLVTQPAALVGREIEVIAALMSKTATMNPANMLEPQDGSFAFQASGRTIDVRVSMMPLATGPKLVLRLLDPSNLLSLEDLGYGDRATQLMRRAGAMPQGLMIIAGPTGSGKTTTLYALIQELATAEKHTVTIEDPVEYRLPLVSQIPIRQNRGDRSVTFARVLRGILRLDPDIILLGEVRDGETAKTALEAALTGHLVLTTIHANSAVGVYTRLMELGAPAYLVAEAMTLAASQRLARRLHTCRRLTSPTEATAEALQRTGIEPPEQVAVPVGCGACGHRGFRGRVAVATLSAPDHATRELLIKGAPVAEIEAAASAAEGYHAMRTDVQNLIDTHQIPPAEAIRVLSLGDM
jgi:type II secretory ATPase GspE/PulE/Tfp pilus assembly ATPase PilB-like protein